MGIADNLLGTTLPGKKVPGIWNIVRKIERTSIATGGQFSVAYEVRHTNGMSAFLKASDLSLMTEGGSMLDRMKLALEMQQFERDILEYCKGNNMDRIVTPIDFGEEMRIHESVKEPVFWIIFELAKCDARVQIRTQTSFDFLWALHAMHNLSIAVSQLHGADVSHNDIKPSNLLIFDTLLQKLADLGRATSPSFRARHDEVTCVGDPRYAAPEILYAVQQKSAATLDFQMRRASDLYLLGSMGYFLITSTMLTPDIESRMLEIHRPYEVEPTAETYMNVLPFWREAFSEAMVFMTSKLPHDSANRLTRSGGEYLIAIRQLCEPDFRLRGHPGSRHMSPYSLERYISLFNRLRNYQSKN